MKAIVLLFCFLPLSALASWNMEVGLGVDGQPWKIEKLKFEEAKENIIDYGNHILKMTIKKGPEPQTIDVNYTLHTKKGEELTLINKGEETVQEKASADIYIRGEETKPKTIITIKLKK